MYAMPPANELRRLKHRALFGEFCQRRQKRLFRNFQRVFIQTFILASLLLIRVKITGLGSIVSQRLHPRTYDEVVYYMSFACSTRP